MIQILTLYHHNLYKANTLLNLLIFLMILFVLQMILICQLFHLKYHFFLLLFCFDLLLYFDFHNHNNHLHLHLHFHSHFHLYCLLLIFHFLFLYFYSSWLSDFNVLLVKIIFYKSSNKFNNSFCPEIILLSFISEFLIMFNVFKRFLASISLIALFLILLTRSLMSIYLSSPILFL